MINVLFTNIGRRTYFVEYALRLKSKYDLNLFLSDTSYDCASFWVSNEVNRIITPRVSDNEKLYVDQLLTLVKENNIQLIIPFMDFELEILAKSKEKFIAIGCKIVVSDYFIISNTLSKRKCAHLCQKLQIPYPKIYNSYNDVPENIGLIVKKDMGSGSVGLQIVNDKQELSKSVLDDFIIQKRINGVEYGIDILNDFEGQFVHATIKKKLGMRAGETDKASVLYDDELYSFAEQVGQKLGHLGNLDMDVIRTGKGEIYAIDLNPRFGGGYPFTYCAGFDYLNALIEMCLYSCSSPIPKVGKKVTAYKGITIYYQENE